MIQTKMATTNTTTMIPDQTPALKIPSITEQLLNKEVNKNAIKNPFIRFIVVLFILKQ